MKSRRKLWVSISTERKISMLQFADDRALIAETNKDLRKSLTNMERTIARYQLKINKKKTQILVCSNREEAKTNISLEKYNLKKVKEFSYLESRITNNGRSQKENVE